MIGIYKPVSYNDWLIISKKYSEAGLIKIEMLYNFQQQIAYYKSFAKYYEL